MQLNRNAPTQRPHIQRYKGGAFTVSGVKHEGSILVLHSGVQSWPTQTLDAIDGSALIALLKAAGADLCLFGCGPSMVLLPVALKAQLKDAGIGTDTMETGAACRTYNMLTGEGRAVAALLLPI